MNNNDKNSVEVLSGQLVMLRRTNAMLERGYAALQSHGVNYKELKEFKDTELLDDADKAPFGRGVQLVHRYLEKVENAIAAAVRRKSFKLATV